MHEVRNFLLIQIEFKFKGILPTAFLPICQRPRQAQAHTDSGTVRLRYVPTQPEQAQVLIDQMQNFEYRHKPLFDR
jgi:hypothetical protein